MAYFSNSEEGMNFEEKWCQKCTHDVSKSCPILLIHLVHNYDQLKEGNEDIRKVLSILIPQDKMGGVHCSMFVNKSESQVDAETEFHKLQHWNAGTPIRG